jgi:hypothetical protein
MNKELADKYETVETKLKGDEYVRAVNGTDIFDSYTWDQSLLLNQLYDLGVDLKDIDKFIEIPALIPKNILNILMKHKREARIKAYKEANKYYANLAGIPMDDDPIIPIPDEFYYAACADKGFVSIASPVHELPGKYLELFLSSTYYQDILKKYPDVEYIKHLGSYAIPIEKSRTSHDGDILNINIDKLHTYHRVFGEVNVPHDMVHLFTNVYGKVQNYIYNTLRGDFSMIYANYNSFIRFLTIYMTIGNCLNELMKKSSSLVYMNNAIMNDYFMLYGLPSVIMDGSDSMVEFLKKFRLLLMDKGTNTVYRVKDIIGYEYTDVYTLIMVKQQAFKNGKPMFYVDENGDKKPMQDIIFRRFGTAEDNTSYFKFRDSKETYTLDEITSGDPRWWNTPEVEEMVQEMNYTLSNSKYIQLSTHMSMDDIWWQSTILLRGLLDNKDETNLIQLSLDTAIDGKQTMSIFEAVLTLIITMNWKHTDFRNRHMSGNMYIPNGTYNGIPACLDLLFNGLNEDGSPKDLIFGLPYKIASFNFDVKNDNEDWYKTLPYQDYLEPDVFIPMLESILNRDKSNLGDVLMTDVKNLYKYLETKLRDCMLIREFRQVTEAYKNLFLVDPLRREWYDNNAKSTAEMIVENYGITLNDWATFQNMFQPEEDPIQVSYKNSTISVYPYDILNLNVNDTEYPFDDDSFTNEFYDSVDQWSSSRIENAFSLQPIVRTQYKQLIKDKVKLDLSEASYGPNTFEALMLRTNSDLYKSLMNIQDNSEAVVMTIRSIIRALETYTGSKLIGLQMNSLGATEYLRILKEVITYFKSYMVEFTKDEFTYIFGGPFDRGGNSDMLNLYDEIAHIKLHMIPKDVLRLYDASHAKVKYGFKEDFNKFIYDDALFRIKTTYAKIKQTGYDIWYDSGQRVTQTPFSWLVDTDVIVGNLVFNKNTNSYNIIIPKNNVNPNPYGNYVGNARPI